MDSFTLSKEQFDILVSCRDGMQINAKQEALNYLCDKGFLNALPKDFQYVPSNEIMMGTYLPTRVEYQITEYGKGYLYGFEQRQKEVDSISSIAKSAKKQASFADFKSWVAISISGVALVFEYAVNHVPINKFFSNLIK